MPRRRKRRAAAGRSSPISTAAARLAGAIDAIVVTDAKSPRASLDAALAAAALHGIAAERVVAPPMLQLTSAAKPAS